MKLNEEIITLAKAKLWLENNVYAGFDSMCLGYDRKSDCIKQFVKDMRDPNYGVKNYDEDDW